jgi:hypothetical protein
MMMSLLPPTQPVCRYPGSNELRDRRRWKLKER